MANVYLSGISIVDEIFDEHGFVKSEPFFVPLHASIGQIGAVGSDIFIINICNIEWIKNSISIDPFQSKIMILDSNFSWFDIESAISKKLETISADSWKEIVKKIGEFFEWEFS